MNPFKKPTKFPLISAKSQQYLSDKSNEIDQKPHHQNQFFNIENIPNQGELMLSNLKMAPGVKYSDNSGNIKYSDSHNSTPQLLPKNGTENQPIRMSRTEYMNMVKNQGNFIRKNYVSNEPPRQIPSQIVNNEQSVKGGVHEKEKRNSNILKFAAIDEKSQNLENDNISVKEEENHEVIDRVGVKNYEHNRNNFEENKKNGGKKRNDNIIINNPVYLKELLLCD